MAIEMAVAVAAIENAAGFSAFPAASVGAIPIPTPALPGSGAYGRRLCGRPLSLAKPSSRQKAYSVVRLK